VVEKPLPCERPESKCRGVLVFPPPPGGEGGGGGKSGTFPPHQGEGKKTESVQLEKRGVTNAPARISPDRRHRRRLSPRPARWRLFAAFPLAALDGTR